MECAKFVGPYRAKENEEVHELFIIGMRNAGQSLIYLLVAYEKGRKDNLSQDELAFLRGLIKE